MNGFAIAALIMVGVTLAVGGVILGVWMIIWNVSDIIANGMNFWNVFWLVLVAIGLLQLGTSRSKS